MKRLLWSAWLVPLACLLPFTGAVRAAGTVEVQYVEPDRYADIGRWNFSEQQNLSSLSMIFKSLGRKLPEGQTLQLQVLDVDLAGEVEPTGTRELRIVRGGVDWPRMTLRYTLKQGQQTLKSGTSELSDMAYTFGLSTLRSDSPLPYEKRMVDDWFKRTVLGDEMPRR